MTAQDDSRNQLSELEEISKKRNECISQLTDQHAQALAAQQTLAEQVADVRVAVTKAHEQFAAAEAEFSHIQQGLQQNRQLVKRHQLRRVGQLFLQHL